MRTNMGSGVYGQHSESFDPEDADYKPRADKPTDTREAEHNERLAHAWSKVGTSEKA